MPKFDFSSLLGQASQEEKKTPKIQKPITPKKKQPKPVERAEIYKNPITIRKLMAVREMFELKQPKIVNKESLANLIIKALERR